jgi:hypothetical protein
MNLIENVYRSDYKSILKTLKNRHEGESVIPKEEIIAAFRLAVNVEDFVAMNIFLIEVGVEKLVVDKTLKLLVEKHPSIFKAVVEKFPDILSREYKDPSNHPMVYAVKSGNQELVLFIYQWLNNNNTSIPKELHVVKSIVLQEAARRNMLNVCKKLIIDGQQLDLVLRELAHSGYEESIMFFIDHHEFDLSRNNFEILQLVSPNVELLMYLLRHKSIEKHIDNLPYFKQVNEAMKSIWRLQKESYDKMFHKISHDTKIGIPQHAQTTVDLLLKEPYEKVIDQLQLSSYYYNFEN